MTYVSIIIPFNKPKRYLKDCLDSLANQNLSDCEIILILNGLKEDISDLIDDYDANLIIKEFEDEINVAKARNIGLDIASGEYVYFMDSDDYLYENALDKLIDAASKSNADFINGERIKTPYICQRFNEDLEKPHNRPLKKGKLDDLRYSMKLLVGSKTDRHELLSALHSLIKKDKIKDIRFDENERYFTDYYFIIDALTNCSTFLGVEDAIYAKRHRDDPVNITSLNQEIEKTDFTMHFNHYHNVISILNTKSDEKFIILNDEVRNTMLKFYYHIFSLNFIKDKDDKWRTVYFDEMSEISKDFNPQSFTWKDRFEIKALRSKNKGRFEKLIKARFAFVNFKRILKEHWRFNVALYDNIYNKKDVKDNQIIFISFGGKYYSDSPKYIYEYLYENYSDKFEFVWVINDKTTHIPGNPKKVERFSRQYFKEMARSKYWVTNGRHSDRLDKKDSQVIVSTWHGTPLKRLGLDIGDIYTKNPKIKESYIKNGLEWDYLISPNRYTSDILKSSFAYPRDILESGYPRNDILYNANEDRISEIRKNLNLEDGKKTILYAPTWRDDEFYDSGSIKFNLKLDLKMLEEALGDEYCVLIRTHYFIADKLDLSEFGNFAIDVSRYDDIAELYLISDILITDYSSVFFDYANLKRPILFYTYDLDKYEHQLRGFYIDIRKDVPGPLLFTTQEVIDSIKNIGTLKEEYKETYDEFYEKFCNIDDGNASRRIVEKVWK